MNKNNFIRIIDANLNRTCEGVRVVEDIVRFHYEDENLTERLRILRHRLRNDFSIFDDKLIFSRDSVGDIGKKISEKSRCDKKNDLKQIIKANFKRISESLRSIEEITKIIDYPLSKKIETYRFESYRIEKNIFVKINKIIPKGIYCITAENFANGKNNLECAAEMIKGGAKIIQYREKYKKYQDKIEDAKIISALCAENDVKLIINDDIDIALLVNAAGVHLGQDDMNPKDARRIVGEDKIIGISTHSPKQAQKAIEEGADYIGVGPIFPTKTKDTPSVGYEYLKYAVDNVKIPFIAIGGINEERLDKIIDMGAERIALVSDIVSSDDIVSKLKRLEEKFNKTKRR